MATTTTELQTLDINLLSKEQYDALVEAGTINENALYLTPEESGSYSDLTITLSSNAESATGRVQVATNATATTSKLETTTITGVNGSVTASKAVPATNQTTATGVGSASTTNTDWLKGITVTGETLVIGAATMDTQTTSQYTFSDITVPKAASSTTVATGSLTSSGSGAEVAIGVTSSKTYLGAQASGANTTWNNKNIVNAVTGYSSPVTSTVLGSETTLSYTNPTITVTPTTTNIKATASGANTSWNNKDQVTVLTDSTDVVVDH